MCVDVLERVAVRKRLGVGRKDHVESLRSLAQSPKLVDPEPLVAARRSVLRIAADETEPLKVRIDTPDLGHVGPEQAARLVADLDPDLLR
jgi:hypothetical protein